MTTGCYDILINKAADGETQPMIARSHITASDGRSIQILCLIPNTSVSVAKCSYCSIKVLAWPPLTDVLLCMT